MTEGLTDLFPCPKCGTKHRDWHLLKTKEDVKKFNKDGVCVYCAYPEKYKRETTIIRRRKK